MKVESRNGLKDVDKIYYNGKVPTLDIEMEDGTIFTCSYNHKFLVNTDNGQEWKRADELEENDDIVEFNS